MNLSKLIGLVSLGALAAACSATTGDNGKTASANDDSVATPAVCTDAQTAALASAPIIPPGKVGGMDLGAAFAPSSTLTFSDFQKTATCGESTDAGFSESGNNGPITETAALFGPLPTGDGPFEPLMTIQYSNATGDIFGWSVGAGYTGAMTFTSRSDASATQPNPFGQHTYSIAIGQPILRDGQPFAIDWTTAAMPKQVTELFDAILATFGPSLQSTQADCTAVNLCTVDTSQPTDTDNGASFSVRPLGLGIAFSRQADGSLTPSTILQGQPITTAAAAPGVPAPKQAKVSFSLTK